MDFFKKKNKEEKPEGGNIITDSKDAKPLNIEALLPGEIFVYLGKRAIKKEQLLPDVASDSNMPESEVLKDREGYELRYSRNPDGSRVIDGHSFKQNRKKVTLHRVQEEVRQEKEGKKMIAHNHFSDPIDPKQFFQLEGEPIKYENIDLAKIVLERRGDALVDVTEEEKLG